MPAIFDSLVHQSGLTPHVAWRVSFIVPFILITVTALAMLLLTEDTPTGKWSDRGKVAPTAHVVAATGDITDKPVTRGSISSNDDKKTPIGQADVETGTGEVQIIDEIQHEVIQKPSGKEILKVLCSLQTITLMAAYVCSFGGELAINSILGSYYLKNFPYLGQTKSGRWAAMFGLLNIVTRPAGGFFADLIFKWTKHNLWAKKFWIHFVGVLSGIFLVVIGQLDPHNLNTMMGLIALMAIFLEAGNGANFALVPHVHPYANGKSIQPSYIAYMQLLTGFRYRLRLRRCGRQPRRHHIRHHFPVQWHALCSRLLAHGHNYHRAQLGVYLG